MDSDTGVCEINTDLEGAGVFNVPTPAPLISKIRADGGSPHLDGGLTARWTDDLLSQAA